MNDLAIAPDLASLAAPSSAVLRKIYEVERRIRQRPQIEIQTEHVIHGGMYARTVRLTAGMAIVGVRVKVPTVLILNGDALVVVGEQWKRMTGYNVLTGSAGRKGVFVALKPTELTMVCASNAKTVAQAEADFTDEAESLLSRRQDGNDVVTVTGE
ncbi:MAG: hypothetical protein WAK20_02640 [Candidatus Acidiferrum sp.]